MRPRGNCYYCKGAFNYDDPQSGRFPTREHRRPKSRGGGGGTNIVVACSDCNNEKGNMKEFEFKTYLSVTAGIPHRLSRRIAWEQWKARSGQFNNTPPL